MKAVRWWLAAGAMLLGSMSVYGCSDESDARDGFDNSSSSGGRRRGSSSGDESSSGGSSSGSSNASSSGGNSASSSSGGGSSSSSSGGEESDAGATSSSSSSGGSSSGGSVQCTPLVPGEFIMYDNYPEDQEAYYAAIPDGYGDHTLYLDFIRGLATPGQVSFATPPNNDYLDCQNCLYFEEDAANGATYLATEGTLTISQPSQPYIGLLNGTLANVKLVKIDDGTLEPIPGGTCFSIANAPIAVDDRP